MISEIAYQLISHIAGHLQFTDKWAGLVVPMKKSVNKIEKILPVSMPNPDRCDESDYMDLVPDSTKTSIMYCERIGEVALDMIRKEYYIASADLRVVLWYNLNRMTEGLFVDEGIVASNLIAAIPKRLADNLFTYVTRVNIYPSTVTTGAEIFNKYTYDEVRTQFVTFPYGAVAVDVNIQYVINKCAENLIEDLKCTEPDYVADT